MAVSTLNNVTNMTDGPAGTTLALPATGTVSTSKTYTGQTAGGVLVDATAGYGITVTVTGAVTGSLQVLVSNDNINFAASGAAIPVSAAGTFAYDAFARYKYVRLTYTATTGTGTALCLIKRLTH